MTGRTCRRRAVYSYSFFTFFVDLYPLSARVEVPSLGIVLSKFLI